MTNHQNPPLISDERLAEIRDRARRQVEAELADTAASQQARPTKRRWIPLDEAWRRLFKINRDPKWIDSVLQQAAASGDVGFRNHPQGGNLTLLRDQLRGQRLRIDSTRSQIERWDLELGYFSVRNPWRAVEVHWRDLAAFARDLLP